MTVTTERQREKKISRERQRGKDRLREIRERQRNRVRRGDEEKYWTKGSNRMRQEQMKRETEKEFES